jgi:CxxC motif-containing protein (DUF1111 family)
MKPHFPSTLPILVTLLLTAQLALAQAPAGSPPPPPPPQQQPPPTGSGSPQNPPVRNPAKPRPFPAPSGPTKFGDPLIGLTDAQRADFAAGLDEFQSVETVASGLGPIYNNVSCVSCHAANAVGGSGPITVTRFGRTTNGVFDPLTELGGSLLQQFAIDPAVQEVIPPQANVVVHRQTTPLFGLGLIEAIADADIIRGAQHPVVDGIRGRAAMIVDVDSSATRVARFGWKNQHATLLAFAGDAYLNEMGITNRFFPTENAPNGNTALLAQFDTVADPEDVIDPTTGKSDIDRQADFMRYLAPPPALPLTASAAAGRNVFNQINCAVCHTPMMTTAPNAIAALDRKPVPLYSDLLLHDMGILGDGIAQAAAQPREMRTAPLWGLRASGPYLHDGRAGTIDDAIRGHEGEAAGSRDRYLRLTATQRQQLLDFLGTL